jgi:hypothetical protein
MTRRIIIHPTINSLPYHRIPTYEEELKALLNLANQDLYVLSDSQKKAVRDDIKETLRNRLESGDELSIHDQDRDGYDEKFNCELNEVNIPSSYEGILRTYRYDPAIDVTNLQNFLECMQEQAEPRISQFYIQNGQMKFFIGVSIIFENTNGDHIQSHFTSNFRRIHNLGQIDEKYESVIDEIWRQVEEFNMGGSGQVIVRIVSGHLNMGTENPGFKSKGRSYIETPKEFKYSKGLCNVKNNDNECFKWSILACLYPQGKNGHIVSKYYDKKDELKFPDGYNKDEGFEYEGNMIKKFEELNLISVNIFGKSKKKGVYPLRISQKKYEKEANLWYIENEEGKKHYIAIQNFDSFMSRDGERRYYCKSCLNSFNSKEKLTIHQEGELCIKEGDSPTRIVLPKKGTSDAIVEFKKESNWKSMRYPVVIYADTESLLVKPTDTK